MDEQEKREFAVRFVNALHQHLIFFANTSIKTLKAQDPDVQRFVAEEIKARIGEYFSEGLKDRIFQKILAVMPSDFFKQA